ncbi:HK97 gp10 family phage protein [bacterium]|nr:HK97 gp10 family phage protein [bacterium]MDB4793021.1 HK97 gp10 family phage protein [bacterium]
MGKSLVQFSVGGIDEISDLYKKFAFKDANKIIKKIVREELKPVAAELKREYPKDSGATAKEIKVRAGTRKRGWINLEVASKDDNFIPKFIEYGTVDKNGNQLIKPRLVYKEVFDKTNDKVRAKIIKRISEATVEKLSDWDFNALNARARRG